MLFTSVFTLVVLATFGRSAPAAAEPEVRASKYHCVTKYSGKLSGTHHGKAFSFTNAGKLVTYSGDHPKSNVIMAEFQARLPTPHDLWYLTYMACSNSTGEIEKDNRDWVGRLRVKGTNSCVDLSHKVSVGHWLPEIVACNSKKLTSSQTWRYDASPFGLDMFWAGWYNHGSSFCRAGYKHIDDGKPRVTSKKQIQVECAGKDLSEVHFWKLL